MVATLVDSCPLAAISRTGPASLPGLPSPPVGAPMTVGVGGSSVAAIGGGGPDTDSGPGRSGPGVRGPALAPASSHCS